MSTADNLSAAIVVLQWLFFKGEKHYNTAGSKPVQALLSIAEAKFPALSRSDLQEIERSRGAAIDFKNGVILLEPPKGQGGSVAVLQCSWTANASDDIDCSVYYGVWFDMVAPQGMEVSADGRNSAPVFLGHRVETPGRGDNHNFYHIQPCKSIGLKEVKVDVPHALAISDRYPTWPLAAKSDVEMLLCVVIALYGFHGFDEFRNATLQSAKHRKMQPLLEAMDSVSSIAH